MLVFKQHQLYPDIMSEHIIIHQSGNKLWTVQKIYKPCKYLSCRKWTDTNNDGIYGKILTVFVPLSLKFVFLKFIYPHLGMCNKSLRSKFYIGRAIEKRKKRKR